MEECIGVLPLSSCALTTPYLETAQYQTWARSIGVVRQNIDYVHISYSRVGRATFDRHYQAVTSDYRTSVIYFWLSYGN
jgi:hypothetical protein